MKCHPNARATVLPDAKAVKRKISGKKKAFAHAATAPSKQKAAVAGGNKHGSTPTDGKDLARQVARQNAGKLHGDDHAGLGVNDLRKARKIAAPLLNKRATEQQASPEALPGSFVVKVSPKTSALLRWYCGITHHRPAHVVEGLVRAELEAAKEAYEENECGSDAFDIVLCRVLDAQLGCTDERAELVGDGNGETIKINREALKWLHRYLPDVGRIVDDIASGIIVHALSSVYEGGREKSTSESVKNWDAWKTLNEAVRRACKWRIAETKAVPI